MTFKKPRYIKSKNDISLGNIPEILSEKIDYPVFCFRHLHSDCGIEQCLRADNSFVKQFLKKIDLISKLSWYDIQFSDRRGHGTEKIPRSAIRKSVPSSITADVKDFLSFYFNGDRGRIIGYRNQFLFHIVFIDTDLEVYNH